MKSRVAATVTMDDIQTYFKGEHWRATIREDGAFEGRSDSYLIELEPKGPPAFAVSVSAYEDDSDADDAVTDDPMKFLVEFLKTGTAGDEALQSMASVLGNRPSFPPVVIANLLRAWAFAVQEGKMGPQKLAKCLRRASLLPDMDERLPLLASLIQAAAREEVELKEAKELADKMEKKGWRVKVEKGDHGLPILTVDIAGVYEAKIQIDHIPWKYSFEVHNHPETKQDGVTDDPIEVFRSFYKSDAVQTAKSDLKAGKKEKAEQAEEQGTVKPGKKKPNPDDFESGGA